MGLLLSVVISYAGIHEAIECIKHIINGIIPDTDPDFQDIVEYYTKLLRKSANQSTVDWTSECGQGYLSLTEDKNGKLESVAVKYYDGQPSSTAILFSTKISSFGQDSLEDSSQTNGDYRSERYIPTKTKTLISNTSESISVGYRNRSPTPCDNISDLNHYSGNSSVRKERDVEENTHEEKDKLRWHYRPLSPSPQPKLPEIHFQSFDGAKKEDTVYSEDFLRSLDGIKFRPLQRNDPSGRRRSFKKRHSSSSTSSRESRASREEELKMFTSLEEAEFERMNKDGIAGFGSTPNLVAHSHSRSRSRENSKEKRNESWSVEASVDSTPDEDLNVESKPLLKDLPKLDSFDEEKEETKDLNEVTEEEEEVDFWGNSGD